MYDPGTPFADRILSYGAANSIETDAQQQEIRYSNWYNYQEAMRSDDSGAASPPLWKNSPSPSRPLLSHHNYGSNSPSSRTEAIVRGRWELMEMVRNMPESSYELSLKDLVEHHGLETQSPRREVESVVDKDRSLHQRAVVKVKREDQSKRVDRNLSFENKGLFLNMVFPFSIKSKKKTKFASNSVKVSPKPEGLKNGGETDWWKRKFRGSSDSDSSRTSENSGSSGSSGGDDTARRKRNGFLSACWPVFHSRGSKSAD